MGPGSHWVAPLMRQHAMPRSTMSFGGASRVPGISYLTNGRLACVGSRMLANPRLERAVPALAECLREFSADETGIDLGSVFQGVVHDLVSIDDLAKCPSN